MHTDVFPLNRVLGRAETETNILIPSPATLADLLRSRRLGALLVIEEDVRLLLEGALALDCQFGRHDCGVEQSVEIARGIRPMFFEVVSREVQFAVGGENSKLRRSVRQDLDLRWKVRRVKLAASGCLSKSTQTSPLDDRASSRVYL